METASSSRHAEGRLAEPPSSVPTNNMPTNPVVDLVGRGGETDSWLSRCRHGALPPVAGPPIQASNRLTLVFSQARTLILSPQQASASLLRFPFRARHLTRAVGFPTKGKSRPRHAERPSNTRAPCKPSHEGVAITTISASLTDSAGAL